MPRTLLAVVSLIALLLASACVQAAPPTALAEQSSTEVAAKAAEGLADGGELASGGGLVEVQPAPVEPTPPPEVKGLPEVTAEAYVVIDGLTGEQLMGYQAHAKRQPASLTKIMTTLLAIESGKVNEVATVPEDVNNLRASTLMGVKPGMQVPVWDLLMGMMLPSGNDAAIAVATHVAGDEGAFVKLMNAKARALGLKDTSYGNSHGLDFGPWGGNFTSAADLAELSRVALNDATFRQLANTRSYFWTGVGKWMANLNTWMNYYPGANGVKIGYTRRAGNTIVASAYRNGRWIIAVALGTTQRDLDATRLMNAGFATPKPPGT